MPFLIWLRVLSFWPFFVDFAYAFGKLVPCLAGGHQSSLHSELGLILLVIPAIFVLSILIYDVLVVMAAIGAKWLLLGRFQEGSYSVSHLYLFFFEITFLLTSSAQAVMRDNSQTIVNNLFMKVRT